MARLRVEPRFIMMYSVFQRICYIVRDFLRYGKEFTDRLCTTGERQPTGRHPFDQGCAHYRIDHRLITPGHPQTNGRFERSNGRISEVLATTYFDSSQALADTLIRYVRLYNHPIPQKALGHIAPVQALKNWQQKDPKRFKKRVYNLTRLNTPHYFAYAVIKLLQNPDTRQKLGAAGRSNVMEHFSWERQTQRLEGLFLTTIGLSQSFVK